MYPNHGFTLVTLFFFLVGLFVNDSWARDAPLNTEPTLNANNFRFDLSGSIRKQDHALASRAVDLGPRDLYSDYATYSAKGNRLICLTKMDDAAAAAKLDRDPAAEYTTVAEMEAAGWVSSTDKLSAAEIADANTKMEGYLSGTLMSSIGVDLSNNELVDWRWTVGEDGVLTAEDLEENTGETAAAQYQNWYNVQGGLIIVNLAWSPGYVVGQNSDQEWWPEDVTDDTVTALNVKQLSDVMYIEWASQATDVTSLEYVIPLNVVNPGTRSAMTLAMASVASTWSTPEVFYPGSEAFDALVGSPNGNAQAWILINHKAQLGVKTISSIRVWTSSTIKAGQPNVFPDTEEWAAEADKRNMCYIYYDDPEEDGIFEYDGDAYWGAM
ncbi:hypothetical protein N7520_003271 [Penicillium odoratum]|uniref:uncharacterized protein n=1 Tax=Penicillium odoratum TaxID=1167516 RepID=UPI002549827F|nr:uncharacterized protein N7520_003271 [Penicillium odoratum]KAJ5768712.1 hypothetical protein N7520_003271 [Penicillium odoratum]